jgi:predicted HTH transcriptional regulator
MSYETIKVIVDARQFQSLIGQSEDTWLEVKGRNPYDLLSPIGRYELSKDVSAFANTRGGFVLIGMQTDQSSAANLSRIVAFDLLPEADFDRNRYLGIIGEHVRPDIENLSVQWVRYQDPYLGLGIIEIPPQRSELKYFLTAKIYETGIKLKEIFFGLSQRNDASNDSLSLDDLYRMMQKGKSPLAETLSRLEGKIDALHNVIGGLDDTGNPTDLLDERINRVFRDDQT